MLLLQRAGEASRARGCSGVEHTLIQIEKDVEAGASLLDLHYALQRESDTLLYLVRHAKRFHSHLWQEKFLVWDYRLMRCWFVASRLAFPESARRTLVEMSRVMVLLAGSLADGCRVDE